MFFLEKAFIGVPLFGSLRVYVLLVVFCHWYSSILYSHLILSSMAKLLFCVVMVFNLLLLKLVSLASPFFFHESWNDCM